MPVSLKPECIPETTVGGGVPPQGFQDCGCTLAFRVRWTQVEWCTPAVLPLRAAEAGEL